MQLKSRAECALWFVESFGLNVENIHMRDSDGIRHTMAYQNIDQISMNEKILYLLDNISSFCFLYFGCFLSRDYCCVRWST